MQWSSTAVLRGGIFSEPSRNLLGTFCLGTFSEPAVQVAASSVRCSTPAANVARVTCIEEVRAGLQHAPPPPPHPHSLLTHASLPQVKPGESKLVATNIYERHEDGSWRMSLHHAGPMVG